MEGFMLTFICLLLKVFVGREFAPCVFNALKTKHIRIIFKSLVHTTLQNITLRYNRNHLINAVYSENLTKLINMK